MTAPQTPAAEALLADDLKQLQEALSMRPLPEIWKVGPDFDNDGTLERIIGSKDGSMVVAVALDFGPNNPHLRAANASLIAACYPERIARLLSHISTLTAELDQKSDAIQRLWKQRDELVKERDALKAEVAQLTQYMQVSTRHPNSQSWAGMDGAIAFHLIERHSENWADAALMMNEWRLANTTTTDTETKA